MKSFNAASENDFFSRVVFEELKRLGVHDVFIAPGSRSTPLVIAAAETEGLRTHVHFDERGLAFWALGCAKMSKQPVAIITTSGSATVNLMPAIVEAHQTKIPLLLLTADRPFELRDSGANQAIDQIKMYSHFVCDYFEFSPPTAQTPYPAVLTTLDLAVEKAMSLGPVHLNFSFREPLSPPPNSRYDKAHDELKLWFDNLRPYNKTETPKQIARSFDLPSVRDVNWNGSAVIVAGGGLEFEECASILDLAESHQLAVLPDILSGLRFRKSPQIINHAEMVLEISTCRPELILWFGGPLQSKKLADWVQSQNCTKVFIREQVERIDDRHQNKLSLRASTDDFVKSFKSAGFSKNSNLLRELASSNEIADGFVRRHVMESKTILEPQVAAKIIDAASQKGAFVYSGSSRPVRDFERFGRASASNVSFYSNRGASGIDGNLATFAGLLESSSQPGVALVGDLAFLHDQSSLCLFKNRSKPSVLVVINNDGGGIFSFLPVHSVQNHFEKYFGTPHGLEICALASAQGLNAKKIKSIEELDTQLAEALRFNQTTVLEVCTSRVENFEVHRSINEMWRKAFSKS